MQKWDYKFVQVPVNQLEGTLKQLGAEGWELVAAKFGLASVVNCILKRPIAESRDEP